MSQANSEQIKAIQHSGGVLLSAGAGSGKTFVLTEHMIYLSKKFMQELSPDTDQFKIDINSKFRKIVLMTFTNKAAGEIELRVKKRFDKETSEFESEKDLERWSIICDALKNLTITTIHGFCFKLIRQGFFTNVNPNVTLSNEAEIKKRLEEFYDAWVTELAIDNRDLMLKSKNDILKSLLTVFMDPSLRQAWKNDAKSDEDLFHKIFLSDEKFELALFKGELDWLNHDFEGKNWFDELFLFMRQYKRAHYSKENFKALFYYLYEKDFKIPVTPRAKGVSENLKALYISYKEVKDFLKANKDDFHAYFSKNETVQEYSSLFKNLVNYVEKEYVREELFTFSDLEYITLTGLQNEEARESISKEYEYLIIDEFQDTSFVQFEIIKNIVLGDFDRVFCVGDPKQAIYGFRGGELGVFEEVSRKVPLNLSLLNNYRSDKHIIDFNNKLFEHIFALGSGYENEDRFSVKVDYQNFPDTKSEEGELYRVQVDLDCEDEKLTVDDVEYIEACAIIDDIKYQLANSEKDICVLYRKLKPSKLLTKLLIENEISFISQVKVPITEDPMVAIFYALIRYQFNKSKRPMELLLFELNSILQLLFGTNHDVKADEINSFFSDHKNFGLSFAFSKLLEKLKFLTANTDNSLKSINEMVKISGGDLEIILELLEKLTNNSYNLDFHYGKGTKRVHIMTAHASKGLQFNHIILGGIYTNESSNVFYDLMGSIPGSFQWREDKYSKQKFKTPEYILEHNIKKLKEFSETKRLFYVAATRAENSLSYIEINFGESKFSPYKNAWINGVHHFFNTHELAYFKTRKITDDIPWDKKNNYQVKIPLFHTDTLGSTNKENNNNLMLLPELSVTRFSLAAICPRKFYLKNILKLNGDESLQESFKEEEPVFELSSREFTSSESAMERGSKIHDQISQVIKGQLSLSDVDQKNKTEIVWALDNFDLNCEKSKYLSEEEIKFDVYGHMISGIPDLVVENEEKQVYEVWDFKTGKIHHESNGNYWAQLMLYAFYIIKAHKIDDKNKSIKIVLCYVDAKENLEQNPTVRDVENFVFDLLSKTQLPDIKNTDQCEKCEFNNICNIN